MQDESTGHFTITLATHTCTHIHTRAHVRAHTHTQRFFKGGGGDRHSCEKDGQVKNSYSAGES